MFDAVLHSDDAVLVGGANERTLVRGFDWDGVSVRAAVLCRPAVRLAGKVCGGAMRTSRISKTETRLCDLMSRLGEAHTEKCPKARSRGWAHCDCIIAEAVREFESQIFKLMHKRRVKI